MTHDSRDDRPVDFSALRSARLDPAAAPERWGRLVGRIESAAAPELARRAARLTTATGSWLVDGVASAVARFTRPALVAAAAAILAAVSVSRQAESTPSAGEYAAAEFTAQFEDTVAQALSVGQPGAAWIVGQQAPSVEDLVPAVYDDGEPE